MSVAALVLTRTLFSVSCVVSSRFFFLLCFLFSELRSFWLVYGYDLGLLPAVVAPTLENILGDSMPTGRTSTNLYENPGNAVILAFESSFECAFCVVSQGTVLVALLWRLWSGSSICR